MRNLVSCSIRWLVAIVIYGAIVGSTLAEGPGQRPGFTKLKDAFVFIDAELDKQDWIGLKNALFPPYQGEYYRTAWTYLRDLRGNSRLVNLELGKEFPTEKSESSAYTVDMMNDRVRVEFCKSNGKWYLSEVAGTK